MLFGFGVEFFLAEDGEDFHFLHDLADVLDGVDYVAGAGFSLGADHAGAFGDAAQGFAEVAGSADEGDLEGVLVDVMSFVGGGEDFGFVDVVDAEFLQNLGFREMSDAALGHDRDGHGGHDFADLFGARHAGNAAFGADLRGDALEGHTATAPARSAMVAWSALVTSMMTPPLSISARPVLRRREVVLEPLCWDMS